jgi:hypothetical protein
MGGHNSSSVVMSKQPVLQSVQAITTTKIEQKPDKNLLGKIYGRKRVAFFFHMESITHPMGLSAPHGYAADPCLYVHNEA